MLLADGSGMLDVVLALPRMSMTRLESERYTKPNGNDCAGFPLNGLDNVCGNIWIADGLLKSLEVVEWDLVKVRGQGAESAEADESENEHKEAT